MIPIIDSHFMSSDQLRNYMEYLHVLNLKNLKMKWQPVHHKYTPNVGLVRFCIVVNEVPYAHQGNIYIIYHQKTVIL